jgi:hypothetical protein
MTVAQLLSEMALDGRAPMPLNAPPVGPAARRMRMMRLRQELLEPGSQVDVDAVAGAIARRILFTSELRRRLADDR